MTAYRRILVAVDGSAAANKGLREAVRLAGIEGGQLFILYVVNEFYAYASMEGVGLGTDVSTVLRKEGQRLLERAKAVAAKQGVQAKIVQREILGGSAADSIVKEAKKLRADIIVLGTHGRRGVRRLVMGSDAEQVVRTASVPVLLLR
jgi:nucleotide-binding universal stress UspA family protein